MTISPGTLLYALFACLALALAGTSFVHALVPHSPFSKRHRRVVAFTALGIPALFLGTMAANVPGLGPLGLLHALLPILCLSAIYANLVSLREERFAAKLLGMVTLLWNGVLVAVYSVRAAQVLFQFDLGDEFSSLLTCSALTQRSVGAAHAEMLPLWMPLPLLLPPLHGRTSISLVYGCTAGFCASFFLGLHALEMPNAVEITRTLRSDAQVTELALDREIRLGMSLGTVSELPRVEDEQTLRLLGNPPNMHGRIARARELGLDRVRLSVRLAEDWQEEFFAKAKAVRELLHEQGIQLVIALLPPDRTSKPRPASAQRKRAQEAQWILTERVQPDMLVLFSQPLSEAARTCYGPLPIERLAAWIRSCARTIREAHPAQRLGIELTPGHPDAFALYGELREDETLLQEMGFALDARSVTLPSLQQMLLELEGWLVMHPAKQELGIVAMPPAPLGLGGMQAQNVYVQRVVAFAEKRSEIANLDLGPMWDGQLGWNGYWDQRDVARPALAELRRLVLQVHASPPR